MARHMLTKSWEQTFRDELTEARKVALKTEPEFREWLFGEMCTRKWARWAPIYADMKTDVAKILRTIGHSQRHQEGNRYVTEVIRLTWIEACRDSKVWYLYAWLPKPELLSMRAVGSIVWVMAQISKPASGRTDAEKNSPRRQEKPRASQESDIKPYKDGIDAPILSVKSPALSPPKPIVKFVAKLSKNLKKVEKLLSQVYDEPIEGESTRPDDDPCVFDLQIAVTDRRRLTPMIQLREGLSQRCLAIEFEGWELELYGTSTVARRADDLSVESSRKERHLSEFLNINKDRFHDTATARAGIRHGIKLLICERLLNGIGISAILIFQYAHFKRINYKELDGLKDAVKAVATIKKLAEQKADWLDDRQRHYNGEWRFIDLMTVEVLNTHYGADLIAGTRVKALVSPDRNTETSSTDTSTIAPISPPQQTHSLRYEPSRPSPASRFPSLQSHIDPNSPLYSNYNGNTIGCDGINGDDTGGMAMDGIAHVASSDSNEPGDSQWMDRWTESFNSQSQAAIRDTSMVFKPSCHIQPENLSIESSTYTQQANPLIDALYHEHITYTSFDPSSYIQETPFVGNLCQEQMGAT